MNDGAELLLLYTPVLKLVLRTIFNWVLKKVLDYETLKKTKQTNKTKQTKTKTKKQKIFLNLVQR